MTQTSPFPSLPPPSTFSPLPSVFLPFPSPSSLLRRSGGRVPSCGVRGLPPEKKIEIEIGFGAFWRIFVSKRQLNINIQIRAKRRTYKLRMTNISEGILPPSGCNSLPPEPNLDASCAHFPCRRPVHMGLFRTGNRM